MQNTVLLLMKRFLGKVIISLTQLLFLNDSLKLEYLKKIIKNLNQQHFYELEKKENL